MVITKEQTKELEKALEHHKKYGKFICEECNKRLIGMDELEKHVSEESHYVYSQPGTNLKLGIL